MSEQAAMAVAGVRIVAQAAGACSGGQGRPRRMLGNGKNRTRARTSTQPMLFAGHALLRAAPRHGWENPLIGQIRTKLPQIRQRRPRDAKIMGDTGNENIESDNSNSRETSCPLFRNFSTEIRQHYPLQTSNSEYRCCIL